MQDSALVAGDLAAILIAFCVFVFLVMREKPGDTSLGAEGLQKARQREQSVRVRLARSLEFCDWLL